MIIGNLNHSSLTGPLAWVRNTLLRPKCSLPALSTREDGCWQPEGCRWFRTLGISDTQPAKLRHAEYHYPRIDIQMVIIGCEGINAGTRSTAHENDEERKPDLFIASSPESSAAITLHVGDFATFMSEEPYQALCVIGTTTPIRKVIFKVPRDMLEVQKERKNDNGNDPGTRNTGPDDRANYVGQDIFQRTATACVSIASCIGILDRSTGFCRVCQSKRGDDYRVYGGHGGATKNPVYQQR